MSQATSQQKSQTFEHSLDNGLRVIVRVDKRAPVIVSQIWYKVGSKDEYRGVTGISHALEHMMFQGTQKLPGDSFAELISRHGGKNNAFTAEDYTAYYEEMDAKKLNISFEAEADRMTNLLLEKEAFAKEIQVVMEERRMRTDDKPHAIAWERFQAVANIAGPYHDPIIGWMDDLEKMQVEDLRAWYKKYYAPNNATIIVVGNVEPSEVFKLAEKYFAKIPKGPEDERVPAVELTPVGEKRIKIEIPAKLPYMIWGLSVPSLPNAKHKWEPYALLLASYILDGGESARLPKKLVREDKIAVDINAYYDHYKQHRTQFVFTAIPTEGTSLETIEAAIFKEADKLKTELVADKELNRVKTQIYASEVFEKDSMSEQAILLGLLESVGLSYKEADEFIDNLQAITPEQIRDVAKKYFVKNNLTVAELLPKE